MIMSKMYAYFHNNNVLLVANVKKPKFINNFFLSPIYEYLTDVQLLTQILHFCLQILLNRDQKYKTFCNSWVIILNIIFPCIRQTLTVHKLWWIIFSKTLLYTTWTRVGLCNRDRTLWNGLPLVVVPNRCTKWSPTKHGLVKGVTNFLNQL